MGSKKTPQKKHKQQHQNKVVQEQPNQVKGFFKNPKTPLYLMLLIGVATLVVYFRATGYGFIYNWDDAGYILKNDYIKTLNMSSVAEIFSSFYMHNYHPLTSLTYAIEYSFVGESAWLYHLNNILLHLANTWLVFVLFTKVFKNRQLPAIFIAALFALHPMHVESVAWISERKDVLYTLFFLLALIRYMKYLETGKMSEFIYTSIFFLLSCLSKSAAVTLPVLLFAFDYLQKRKFSKILVLEKIPLFAISLIFGILAIRSQDTAIQDLTPMLSLFERILIVCWGTLLYIVKTILPFHLSAFYPYPLKIDDVLPWYYYLAPLFVIALGIVIWYSKKWGREVIFGFAFFFITISLVLQLMPVGGAIIAERYTYVPYLGLFFIMVLPLRALYENKQGRDYKNSLLYTRLLTILVVVFSILSFNRVAYWKDGDILFTDVIEKYPKFPYAYNNRGFLYFDYYALKFYADNEVKKNAYVEKAYNDYTMAIGLDPTYAGAYANRAVLLYNTGKPQAALQDFNILLTLDPENKDGLIGRANTLSTLEMFEKALPDYNSYLKINDDDAKAWLWRGIAFSKTGDNESALPDFEKTIQLLPDDYEAYYWKGITLHQLKRHKEAVEFLSKAIAFQPDNYEIYSWRGLAYFELKDYDKALADFSTAIDLNPEELSSYVNRSLCYNEQGQYQLAFNDLIFAAERGMPISRDYYESLVRKK